MTKVRLNNGTEIEATVALYAEQFRLIHIYTDKLSMVQACELFDNPENTAVITVERDDETREVYKGYTELYSVQKGKALGGDGMILIWLQPPDVTPDQTQQTMGKFLGHLQ